MLRRAIVALVVGAVAAAAGSAADPVPVKGTEVKYAPTATATVKGKPVPLTLTGVGLRTRLGAHVYTVASYVQDGTRVKGPADVLAADAVRVLHLVMQRTAQPAEFLGAFRAAVGKSYPDDKFAKEFAQLAEAVGENAAAKGDHVTLTYLPGEGVRVQLGKKVDATVKNPAFAQALWEVYLGEKPLDEGLKKGLAGTPTP